MKPNGKQKLPAIYFLVPSALGISPGQRFRFEHYLPALDNNGIKYSVSPYFSFSGKNVLYSRKNFTGKAIAVFKGYLRRIGDLFRIRNYQYVYIHREAAPVGPPFFEWFIANVLRKKIVYDFDDAIWVPVMSEYNKKFAFIKFFGKVARICKWSHLVTVGNSFLGEFARRQNANVMIIPTVVNTETVHVGLQNQDIQQPAIGWTGSFSTLKYLNMILPVLQRLQEEIDFTFYVIADVDPQLPLKKYSFIKWNRESESQDLLNFHIGVMPLTDDELTRVKCGFKAIQYMSLGIPAVVSPVGVNVDIVEDGIDGYQCNTEQEWEEKLRLLLKDRDLRKKMGLAAQQKIVDQYSVKATETRFVEIFN